MNAAKLQELDQRPPVIYLRSFDADSRAARTNTAAIWRWLFPMSKTSRTEEEVMTEALSHFGPVIAIGKPGEVINPLGAARVYVQSGEDWKDIVTRIIKISVLVVIRPATSIGLSWEIKKVLEVVSPHKIVVLLPAKKKYYCEFAKNTEDLFPCGLPVYPDTNNAINQVSGLIKFDQNWTPSISSFSFSKSESIEPG